MEGVKCPHCNNADNQVKAGLTTAGSQRYYCKDCKKYYCPNPKKWKYTEEERKAALRLLASGATGRGVGKVLKMAKSNAYRWAKEEAKKGSSGCG